MRFNKNICDVCIAWMLAHPSLLGWKKCISCGYSRKEHMIDWTDPKCQVTDHFNVSDCLMLHNWNRLATEADGADFDKLTTLCQTMEKIRTLLQCPINVHCMFRSKEYNIEQKILLPTGNDVHSMSLACDFDCNGHLTTDEAKAILLPQLNPLGIRMENNGANSSWIHIDLHPVIFARYFNI